MQVRKEFSYLVFILALSANEPALAGPCEKWESMIDGKRRMYEAIIAGLQAEKKRSRNRERFTEIDAEIQQARSRLGSIYQSSPAPPRGCGDQMNGGPS